MPLETNDNATVRKLCERLYAGEALSEDEGSLLLHAAKRLSTDHQVSFALHALARSSIPGAEEVIASYLKQHPPGKVAAYALNALCNMGLFEKYRSEIFKALYRPSPDNKYPFASVTAIGCMGKCLKQHKDREFAELLIGFIKAEKYLPSAASKDSSLAQASRVAAIHAVGGDTALAGEDQAYEDQCVAQFLAERKFG